MMKKKAILLWTIYFLNLMIFPQFFLIQTLNGNWTLDSRMYILLQLITLIYAVFSYRTTLIEGFKRLKKRPIIRDVLLGYLLRTLLIALLPVFKTDNQENVEKLFQSTSLFSMLLLTCVVAPIVEELVFREGIIGAFKNMWNSWLLTLISTLLFVLLHSISNNGGIDWQSALLYLPLTLPLVGIYRYYQDNVAASIVMHFASNFIALLVLQMQ